LISLKELANKVNGHLIGDGTIIISKVDDIHSATNESIAFAFLPKYKKEIIEKPIINSTGDSCTGEKIKLICQLIFRLQLLWIIIFVLIFFIIST